MATVSLALFASDDLLGATLPLSDGTELRFPTEEGAPPDGYQEPLPADPIWGAPSWVANLEEGSYVQGAVLHGLHVEAPSRDQLARFQVALAALGRGEPEAPARPEDVRVAWERTAAGEVPTLDYQLLTDARQALRTGYAARAVLEAAMAVEWGLANRYRLERRSRGDGEQDITKSLKKARGMLNKAEMLAPEIGVARPEDNNDGGFLGLTRLRRARNDVAHEGALTASDPADDLLDDARRLVELCSLRPWRS